VRRILVIDDDDLVRTAVRQILETKGFDVVIASDGHHALRILDGKPFDAILVDIFMPGMDGLETIRAFRQRSPDIAIVATSGTKFYEGTASAPDFLLMATKLGANASLRKPFRARDLIATIEACLQTRSDRARAVVATFLHLSRFRPRISPYTILIIATARPTLSGRESAGFDDRRRTDCTDCVLPHSLREDVT
jgi:CheY-like chemotaxis protein